MPQEPDWIGPMRYSGIVMRILSAFVIALTVNVSTAAQPPAAPSSEGSPHITVHRIKTCGCCGKWIDHLKAAGFTVTDNIRESREGAPGRDLVPERLRSCHTAQVEGYVVEGHVPADVIFDLLDKRPDVQGIAVAGMPPGSPGMESPNPEPYEVIAFDAAGRTSVFARR